MLGLAYEDIPTKKYYSKAGQIARLNGRKLTRKSWIGNLEPTEEAEENHTHAGQIIFSNLVATSQDQRHEIC